METIVTLLAKDHREVTGLFKALEDGKNLSKQEKEDLFIKLYTELSVHTVAEEEAAYGVLLTSKAGKDIALEGYEEHRVAHFLLEEIARTPSDSESWMPKVKVLREIIDHHVKEEEEEVFPVLKKEFSQDALEDMGLDFQARKDRILSKGRKAS